MNKPLSLFKRLNKHEIGYNFMRIAVSRVSFYGKPFKVHILAKDIVRYNASLISAKLGIRNTKYTNIIKKLIDSGIANARYRGLDPVKMYIKSISVGRGTYLKRREFKGRGRTGVIRRPYSNVELILHEVQAQEVSSGE